MRNPLSALMEDALLSMPALEGEMLPVIGQHANAGVRLALGRRELVDFEYRSPVEVLYGRRTLKGEQLADDIRTRRAQVAA